MADTITAAAPTVSPPATSIQHQTTADLTGRPPARPVHLVQYDQTLPVLAVELTYSGQPYVLPTGAAVNIRMDKRDGHYVYNPALGVDTSRTVAYIVVTQQMTTNAGEYKPILEVVVNGGVAGTASIAVCIDRNPVPEDAIESSDEYKSLQDIVNQVNAIAAAAAQSAAVATAQTQQANQALQDAEAASQAAAASAAEAASYAAITAGEHILTFYIDPTDGGLNCLINTEAGAGAASTTNTENEVQNDGNS